jgi:hypothetical protein
VSSRIRQAIEKWRGDIGSETGGVSILLKAPAATAKMIRVFNRQYRQRFPKETTSLNPAMIAIEKRKLTTRATQGNFSTLKCQISGSAKLVVKAPAIPGVREDSGLINSLKSGKLDMGLLLFQTRTSKSYQWIEACISRENRDPWVRLIIA